MRGLRYPLAFTLLAALYISGAAAPPPDYAGRRAALRAALPESVIVLFGRTESEGAESRAGFFQEPNFYYLTGWSEPGAVLLLGPGGGTGSAPRDILFLPRRDNARERYTGPRASAADAAPSPPSGFSSVLPLESFEGEFARALEHARDVRTLTARPEARRLETLAPMRRISGAVEALAKLRMRKSPQEIEALRRAAEVSSAAHRAAWRRAAPGVYEYQVAAAFTAALLDRGCPRNAFAPICASGSNAVFLHYDNNNRRMEDGDLLLVDAGAECSLYAGDITRTIPVSGRFTPRQRELYEVVLGAQKAVIAAVRPGARLGRTGEGTLFKVAYDYINTHGKDRRGEPLGKYLIHDVSHHVGLEVHDDADTTQPLEAGMVITVEPGIYLPDEGIGIRVEDTVLVTAGGAELLTPTLPKEVRDIERALAR